MPMTITIDGMSCAHCEQTVEEALREVEGVSEASADRASNQAHVDGDVDPTVLVQAVEAAGYTAST